MNQEIQPLFEGDAMKVAVGSTPDPEVAALPKRRQFSAAYKRRIVGEANACQVPGEVGALLRREGLYWSYPRSVDGLRLGIQAVHCGGWGFSVGHILLS